MPPARIFSYRDVVLIILGLAVVVSLAGFPAYRGHKPAGIVVRVVELLGAFSGLLSPLCVS